MNPGLQHPICAPLNRYLKVSVFGVCAAGTYDRAYFQPMVELLLEPIEMDALDANLIIKHALVMSRNVPIPACTSSVKPLRFRAHLGRWQNHPKFTMCEAW